jgi:hypothetical protein
MLTFPKEGTFFSCENDKIRLLQKRREVIIRCLKLHFRVLSFKDDEYALKLFVRLNKQIVLKG